MLTCELINETIQELTQGIIDKKDNAMTYSSGGITLAIKNNICFAISIGVTKITFMVNDSESIFLESTYFYQQDMFEHHYSLFVDIIEKHLKQIALLIKLEAVEVVEPFNQPDGNKVVFGTTNIGMSTHLSSQFSSEDDTNESE